MFCHSLLSNFNLAPPPLVNLNQQENLHYTKLLIYKQIIADKFGKRNGILTSNFEINLNGYRSNHQAKDKAVVFMAPIFSSN